MANVPTENAVAALPAVRQDFQIPEHNLSDLQAKFDKLNKRAAKNGLKSIAIIVGEGFNKVVKTEHVIIKGKQVEVPVQVERFLNIRVEGETPRVNGWDFVATLQHLGEDGNVLRTVPGFEGHLPIEFRTVKPLCAHCNLFRARKDTYVLRNVESGEYKQVGTNCLADFIRTTKPEDLATMAELLASAMDFAGDAEGEGGGAARMQGDGQVSLAYLLSVVWSVIRVDGAFVSRSKARIANERGDYANATASVDLAQTIMFGNGTEADKIRARYPGSPDDFPKAQEIIAWARAEVPVMVQKEQENDYIYNLSIAIKRDFINTRLKGIAASVVTVYQRDLAKKARIKMNAGTFANSKHFGTVGERIKGLGVTLMHTFRHEGNFGVTYITKLLTDEGNVAVWFASRPLNKIVVSTVNGVQYGDEKLVEYGERVVITGTVKKHDKREGVNQTVLSRCTVLTDEDIKQAEEKAAKKAAREAKKAAKAAKDAAKAAA